MGAPLQAPSINDDFGVFDDDDLFEGAEALVAEIESKHPSQLSQPPRKMLAAIPIDVCQDGGDGFDSDDMDDFDFDAAEQAATQTVRNGRGPALSDVCCNADVRVQAEICPY